jgi:23S rRNA (cytidine1920-2'-O)/16S rRNA (cytidine1409-2'-O)-methyltransferase
MKKQKLLDLIINKFNIEKKTAFGLILAGKVKVNENIVSKPGTLVDENAEISIKKTKEYVSRGAYKLLGAFESFDLNAAGKICLDAGCSTGGFTQVLLEKGAKKVYAIDCGMNLLDFSLRNIPEIILMENTRVLDLKKNDFNEEIDFATIDVSFTTCINIIRHLYFELCIHEIVALIKPQFEYKRISKILGLPPDFNGIITDESVLNKIIDHIKKEIEEFSINIKGISRSGIKGTKGNIEYLFYLGS